MEKVRIGVVGARRGSSMIDYCVKANNAEVVAICDFQEYLLESQRKLYPDEPITYYKDFEDFLKHDMDAVVLANYATEHAPFAIRCMKAGFHVFSEVLPFQTLKQGVELIEAVEETGKIYAYGENYCYMPAPYEMRKHYQEGLIGEFEYGEGEYIHNCEDCWHAITYGEPNHWRNNIFAHFYCTHSLGPLIHITGLRPVRVTGFEGTKIERQLRVGSKTGSLAIEMVELENGGLVKSIHGGLYRNSVWYTVYGSKGRMECAREATGDGVRRIYIDADEYSGKYDKETAIVQTYKPREEELKTGNYGHNGSDYFTMYNFIQKILGSEDADIIDVYEAADMYLPGLFAYFSVLAGGVPMDIPNLRDRIQRDIWRNDTRCSDPKAAGDQLLPSFSKGNPDIPPEVYARVKRMWEQYKKENDLV